MAATGLGSLTGSITDPDGNGTIAGLNINGNETATLVINGITESFSNDPAIPFQAPQTYIGADGTKRIIPVSVLSNGGITRTGDQIDIYSAEQGVPAAGQTSTNTPVKNVYLIGYASSAGSLGNQHAFSVIGDPTAPATRPTTGTYTYTGEAVGYAYDYGDGTGVATQFIGPVTITVNYAATAGGALGHITVSQFQALSDTTKPFTVDLVADALASGVLQGTSLTLTGFGQTSPLPGTFQGQTYGVNALQVGGVFQFRSGTRTIVGSFVAAR
ncbi:hypothetical protein [Sphingomonas sp. PAMC 26617]|uniref:hypothetical protein n=1 Tax=Sphingomonas sp. PAMC 26617 TaxID=1112216 RepID=UPI0002897380|nr:hypothetical protein [Sphingomonas sp. PAMC 26617]